MASHDVNTVHQLRQAAIDDTCTVSRLLRMALALSVDLGTSAFTDWIRAELYGYKENEKIEIPAYRILAGEFRVRVPGVGDRPLPFKTRGDPGLYERDLGRPIAEIEESIRSASTSGDNLALAVPPQLKAKFFPFLGPNALPYFAIGDAALHGVVNTVRNIVLEWTNDLIASGVHGGGHALSQEERNVVKDSPMTVINYIHRIQGSSIQVAGPHSSQAAQQSGASVSDRPKK